MTQDLAFYRIGRRFDDGTFIPDPGANTMPTVLGALTRFELTLLLRNGEQIMLNMLLPITFLIGLCVLPLGDIAGPRANTFVPAILAVAVMSSAFTGQAIAVGFDRRYGALKQLGASTAPRWGVIAGKTLAAMIVAALQFTILGTLGIALGWRPSLEGLLMCVAIVGLGTATFAALGLLLGGSLRAEIVLPLANILWFVQLGICGVTVIPAHVSPSVSRLVQLTPSGALAEALHRANDGSVDPKLIAVLAVWGVGAGVIAKKTFTFT